MHHKSFLNIDCDFFNEPAYTGNFYLEEEWKSPSTFIAKSKIWLNTEDFIKRFDLKRKRGATVLNDNQALTQCQKLIDEGFIKPGEFEWFHVDAHHDAFMRFESSYYNHLSISQYKNHEFMLAPIKQDWVKNFFWVYPDYLPEELLDTSHLDFEVIKIPYSRFSAQYHEWVFICLTRNPTITKFSSENLQQLRKFTSEW
jgi:hypothetical protein